MIWIKKKEDKPVPLESNRYQEPIPVPENFQKKQVFQELQGIYQNQKKATNTFAV